MSKLDLDQNSQLWIIFLHFILLLNITKIKIEGYIVLLWIIAKHLPYKQIVFMVKTHKAWNFWAGTVSNSIYV